jgi:hypothetical protein
METQTKYYTAKELADRWKVSRKTIDNLRLRDEIPWFRIPHAKRYRYPVNEIHELEKTNTHSLKGGGGSWKTAPTTNNKKWKVKL